MLAMTCICVRSLAMVKSVGDERLAATVCPTFTSRETTTPSIGERIVVWLKLISANCSAASACCNCAAALCTCAAAFCAPACDCCTCACACSICACDCTIPALDED